MRALVALAMAVAADIVLLGSTAFAQDAEWRHPRNLYSLQLAATGWREVAPQHPGLLAEFRMTSATGPSPICVITERPIPTRTRRTQDQLNRFNSTYQPAPNGRTISDLVTTQIDGVAVRGFRFEDANSIGFLRLFALAEGDGATGHELNCRGPLPLQPGQEAAVAALLNSIHFPLTDQSQTQTGQRWTSPTGVWSLDYVSSGWAHVTPLPPDLRELSIVLVP